MSEYLLEWVSKKLTLNIKSIDQEQFNDGVILLRLLAVLTGEPLEPHQSAVKGLAMQKNAAIILTFTKQRNINIGDAGVAEILSGKEKDVLRILYHLFSSFAKKPEIEKFNQTNKTSNNTSNLLPLIDRFVDIPSSEPKSVKPNPPSKTQNRLSFSKLTISENKQTPASSPSNSGPKEVRQSTPKPLSSEKSATVSTPNPSPSSASTTKMTSNASATATQSKTPSSSTPSISSSATPSSSTPSTAPTRPTNPPVTASSSNSPPAQQMVITFLQNSVKNLKDKLAPAIPMNPKEFVGYCEDYLKSSMASFEDILKTAGVTGKEAQQLIEQFKTWLKDFMDKYRQINNEAYVTKNLPIVKQNIVKLTNKLDSCKTIEEQQKVVDEFNLGNNLFANIQQYMPELTSQIAGITTQIAQIATDARRQLMKKNQDDAEKKALQEALDKAKREKDDAIAAAKQAQIKPQPVVVHHYHYDSSSDSSSWDSDSSSSDDYRQCRAYTNKGKRCCNRIAYGHKKYCRKHSTSRN